MLHERKLTEISRTRVKSMPRTFNTNQRALKNTLNQMQKFGNCEVDLYSVSVGGKSYNYYSIFENNGFILPRRFFFRLLLYFPAHLCNRRLWYGHDLWVPPVCLRRETLPTIRNQHPENC